MGKLFGTDGVRGIVNKELTASLAMKIGESAAYVLGTNKNFTVVIARDTRESGQMLLAAISSGLMSYGAHVIDLGIMPTPAVSYLINKYNADMGVMISASHNPALYNGIKLFNNEGMKLQDDIQDVIESYILNDNLPESTKLGSYEISNNDVDDYLDFLLSTIKNINKDIKLIVDCANGSASVTAPKLFERLDMNPTFININYDGININLNCGSTHLEELIDKVKNSDADAGIAFDGDADRCLMVDSEGNVIDGDYIMAITSLYYKNNNMLTNNTVVGTVMTNLGFRKFCDENEINFVATKVGDRYVLENMIANNYIIGGEQSGHIIFRNLFNTGDGELTAIQILNIMSLANKPLSEIASVMQKYPQVLINIDVSAKGKNAYEQDEDIINIIKETEADLGSDGRILVRASGTENLVRVMIEGLNTEDINAKANAIADLIKQKYGV